MRILLVEDDGVLRDALARTLSIAGYRTDAAGTLAGGVEAIGRWTYELVVLDVGLPDGNGLDVMRRLRRAGSGTRCLVMSARSDLETRVSTLDDGADDFLGKPFSLDEFEARVRRLVRLHSAEKSARLPLGRVTVDLAARQASCDGEPMDLSPRDWQLLAFFACHPGETIGKERLAEAVTSLDPAISDNAVEVAVHRLRGKLAPFGVQLVAIRGLGYRLVVDAVV